MIEDPELRKAIAFEVKEARKYGIEDWSENSGMDDYLRTLHGLSQFFKYVKTLPSHKVLDIGTGRGRAISQMQSSKIGQGLNFEGTILNKQNVDEKKIKNIKLYRTFVESMSSVPDAAYGGILSLYGVCYSQAPEEAIKNIDKKLVVGGVFKGHFSSAEAGVIGEIHLKSRHTFYNAFKKLGYDAVWGKDTALLLAVKPGAMISAAELMEKDDKSYQN